MDEGKILGIVTLDQSAAFDVIEHSILKSKMKLYRFSPHTLNWFQSYLKNRKQYVALESSKSDEQFIGPYACPQGSCLGPLIWNLYCGEAAEVLPLKMKSVQDEVASQNEGPTRGAGAYSRCISPGRHRLAPIVH